MRPIYGHDALLDRLAGAFASGRFPQVTLLTGPAGVGKQRLALWVAQALLCKEPRDGPCGACDACRRVIGLTHPDLHWFVPIPRPKAGDADKQVEEAEETLAGVMDERRRDGMWQRPEGMASHSLASVRLLQRRVMLRPFEGSCKVIILGDAERLVVQEASQEAANALLKVLEEPPADTVVLLTAVDPQGLLPTIRSRVVPLRVPRVSDQVVREFLARELDPPPKGRGLERRVVLAEGAIGRALADAAEPDGPDRRADELLGAVRAGGERWLPRVLDQAPWSARGDFSATLDAVAVRLRGELAEAAGAGGDVGRWLTALERVGEARAAAQGNANPQLTLAVLAGELEELLA